MDSAAIRRYAAQLNAYVRGGGFLIIFACKKLHEWIDVVDLQWRDVDTKDWLWWTKAQALSRDPPAGAEASTARGDPVADMSWHWFGAFDLHPAAQSALNLDDDSGSLLLDFLGSRAADG
jgi:hypothetical protein